MVERHKVRPKTAQIRTPEWERKYHMISDLFGVMMLCCITNHILFSLFSAYIMQYKTATHLEGLFTNMHLKVPESR